MVNNVEDTVLRPAVDIDRGSRDVANRIAGTILGHNPNKKRSKFRKAKGATLKAFHSTKLGNIYHADSLDVMKAMKAGSVDLVMTSPPFGLTREKEYGNVREDEYLNWFRAFAKEFHRILKDSGSLVIDIGGAWKPGAPVRSLYHFKLLIMLCDEFRFHLAQDFYWWNPSKLPAPAEWVNIRRIRVKDAINPVWWLSKTEWPRASNRRVLQPYSPSMETLLANGYKAKLRPSGHDISNKFSVNNGAAIPPISLPFLIQKAIAHICAIAKRKT
ncbi:MAG TPA: site-specific DNA-methyltransferase [Stellaceae bacterium]|nr:site-specific DNA-methyltransferase [Stellaceae bacterium]